MNVFVGVPREPSALVTGLTTGDFVGDLASVAGEFVRL